MTDVSKLPEYIKIKHSGMFLSNYRIIEDMLSLDDNLRLAYELKEEYRHFNSSATILNAEEWLEELILKFLNSNISEYFPFANLLINWHDERAVAPFHMHEFQKNGKMEGKKGKGFYHIQLLFLKFLFKIHNIIKIKNKTLLELQKIR